MEETLNNTLIDLPASLSVSNSEISLASESNEGDSGYCSPKACVGLTSGSYICDTLVCIDFGCDAAVCLSVTTDSDDGCTAYGGICSCDDYIPVYTCTINIYPTDYITSFSVNGQEYTKSNKITVKTNQTITLSNPIAASGYTFGVWLIREQGSSYVLQPSDLPYTFSPSGNTNISAAPPVLLNIYPTSTVPKFYVNDILYSKNTTIIVGLGTEVILESPIVEKSHIWDSWLVRDLKNDVDNPRVYTDDPCTFIIENETNVSSIASLQAGGSVHIYQGSSWTTAKIYIYQGSSWKPVTPYIYQGNSWVPTQ